jgi:hypothetical protein
VRYEVIHRHPAGQGQHFPALLVGDGDRVLGQRADDLFQRKALLSHLDEMVKQPGLLPAQPVFQHDQQAVQPPGQILVEASMSYDSG